MVSVFNHSLTAVELGESVSVAACGMHLRRLGARVVQASWPDDESLRTAPPFVVGANRERISALDAYVNHGKERLKVDPDVHSSAARVEELISQADIVLISGAEDQWQRRGLEFDAVRALAPSAVIGRITMFGEEGPYRDFRGGEMQVQALGGLMYVIGLKDREPLRMGGSAMQYAAGAALLTGVMLGLYRRSRDGVGGEFTTSVFELVPYLEWKNALSYQVDGTVYTRGDEGLPVILRCKDGFAAFYYRDVNWEAIKEMLDDPRLDAPAFATQQSRQQNRVALLELLADNVRTWNKRDLYQRGQALGVPTGYVATMSDLEHSAQYLERGFLERIYVDGAGQGTIPGAPWKMIAAG